MAATSAAFQLGPFERFARDVALARPDFLGVVLDPAGLRKVLLELALRHGDNLAAGIEHDRPRRRRALIERQQISHRSALAFHPIVAKCAVSCKAACRTADAALIGSMTHCTTSAAERCFENTPQVCKTPLPGRSPAVRGRGEGFLMRSLL